MTVNPLKSANKKSGPSEIRSPWRTPNASESETRWYGSQGPKSRNFTHPIFESDFDCLTGKHRILALLSPSPLASNNPRKKLQNQNSLISAFFFEKCWFCFSLALGVVLTFIKKAFIKQNRIAIKATSKPNFSVSIIPRRIDQFSSDHWSQTTTGRVSTYMGDRLGIPCVLSTFWFLAKLEMAY